jgi:hypothetical protein
LFEEENNKGFILVITLLRMQYGKLGNLQMRNVALVNEKIWSVSEEQLCNGKKIWEIR